MIEIDVLDQIRLIVVVVNVESLDRICLIGCQIVDLFDTSDCRGVIVAEMVLLLG